MCVCIVKKSMAPTPCVQRLQPTYGTSTPSFSSSSHTSRTQGIPTRTPPCSCGFPTNHKKNKHLILTHVDTFTQNLKLQNELALPFRYHSKTTNTPCCVAGPLALMQALTLTKKGKTWFAGPPSPAQFFQSWTNNTHTHAHTRTHARTVLLCRTPLTRTFL